MHTVLAKVDESVDPIVNTSWRRCSLGRFRPNRWVVGLTVLWVVVFVRLLEVFGILSEPSFPAISVSVSKGAPQPSSSGEAGLAELGELAELAAPERRSERLQVERSMPRGLWQRLLRAPRSEPAASSNAAEPSRALAGGGTPSCGPGRERWCRPWALYRERAAWKKAAAAS
jgi:hypothetical protein